MQPLPMEQQQCLPDNIELKEEEQLSSVLGQLLLEDSYSIEHLLEKAREKNLNLRELRDQLIKHQQELQQTSLELFNNSYDRFFKLSHLIACLAEPIKHVIQPIQNYRNQLGQLCQNHDNYLKDIDIKLANLEETSRNKLLAERLMSLIKRRDRIFDQIHRIDWLKQASVESIVSSRILPDSSNSIEFRVNCDFVERVYIELHYLLSEIVAIQPTCDQLVPIKKTLESSVLEQQHRLDAWFADVFYLSIQERNKTLVDFMLNIYEQREDFKELDLVWRQQVVRPYLNIILESDTKVISQVRQTYNLLKQFLDNHIHLLGTRAFVSQSFWSEVTEALDRLKQLYSSDDVRSFKERYEMTQDFLRLQDTDSHTSRILGKFDIQGYFNQKSTEIRTSIEACFMQQQPLVELPPQSDQQMFRLKICSQIYLLIAKCWSTDIYIDALDSNFMILVSRVLERFADWLSKLSLSDFRIVGTSGSPQDRMTNFLAKQDAIMRLLIDDCTNLMHRVEELESTLPPRVLQDDDKSTDMRKVALQKSLNVVKTGLDNVRNLQKLLER